MCYYILKKEEMLSPVPIHIYAFSHRKHALSVLGGEKYLIEGQKKPKPY